MPYYLNLKEMISCLINLKQKLNFNFNFLIPIFINSILSHLFPFHVHIYQQNLRNMSFFIVEANEVNMT